jgi:hypothetical protein
MPPSSINFLAVCPMCQTSVPSTTKLGREQLTKALAEDADVYAVHFTRGDGDHEWLLTKDQKANLRKQLANGLV